MAMPSFSIISPSGSNSCSVLSTSTDGSSKREEGPASLVAAQRSITPRVHTWWPCVNGRLLQTTHLTWRAGASPLPTLSSACVWSPLHGPVIPRRHFIKLPALTWPAPPRPTYLPTSTLPHFHSVPVPVPVRLTSEFRGRSALALHLGLPTVETSDRPLHPGAPCRIPRPLPHLYWSVQPTRRFPAPPNHFIPSYNLSSLTARDNPRQTTKIPKKPSPAQELLRTQYKAKLSASHRAASHSASISNEQGTSLLHPGPTSNPSAVNPVARSPHNLLPNTARINPSATFLHSRIAASNSIDDYLER
ncbi:hypothetical protein B0H65DRAFT_134194 [Neurospora tetraspora]|uniref:Uncharacterized protein n=1 Tax=Neurospora tetraspora TaxID=94610 RepID=A0AAE0JLB8_9PEZI|nr:hypothetical protein B0H65DRAFT_134194 [Neurospora tetraspora]